MNNLCYYPTTQKNFSIINIYERQIFASKLTNSWIICTISNKHYFEHYLVEKRVLNTYRRFHIIYIYIYNCYLNIKL